MTESLSFFIQQRVLRGRPLIEVSGTIDRGGGNGLCAAVVEAARLALPVVVDASEVSRVDAEGLRYLVRAALLVEQLGGQLRLVAGPALQQAGRRDDPGVELLLVRGGGGCRPAGAGGVTRVDVSAAVPGHPGGERRDLVGLP